MKKYLFVIFLALCIFPAKVHGAVFYADLGTPVASTTCNSSLGTSTSSPFCSISQFTDIARNAGDVLFVRRNTATTTPIAAASFTSDGTLNQPLIVSADYDNLWNGFATTSETYTPVFGSQFIPTSASSTLTASSTWIYLAGDCYETYNALTINQCQYAYEVQTATSTGIQLFLPYKGIQTGAVVARVMGKNPIVGTLGEASQIFSMSADDYWYFKGLDLRSTAATGAVLPSLQRGTTFFDTIFQGDGINDVAFGATDITTILKKIRTFGEVNMTGTSELGMRLSDFYIDCNNVGASVAFGVPVGNPSLYIVENGVVKNCVTFIAASAAQREGIYYLRNVINNGVYLNVSASPSFNNIFYEDNDGVVGLNSQVSNQISASALSTTTMSTSSNLRSGGGPVNLFIMPPAGNGNFGLSTKFFPGSYYKLFEYPIYAVANVSKTYSVWFNSTSTTNFTSANPLTNTLNGSSTPELYIECEFYNSPEGNASRMLTRSNLAGAIGFSTSTAWFPLQVTCNPKQTGILYLRGWYAKQPNATSSNWFFMDNQPTIN